MLVKYVNKAPGYGKFFWLVHRCLIAILFYKVGIRVFSSPKYHKCCNRTFFYNLQFTNTKANTLAHIKNSWGIQPRYPLSTKVTRNRTFILEYTLNENAKPGHVLRRPFSTGVLGGAHSCAVRSFKACSTWLFIQGHWPLLP